MPYRIDIAVTSEEALDRLVQLGALDVETINNGVAAIMPDGLTPDRIAESLGIADVKVSQAISRDEGSVWMLKPRPVQIGRFLIVPSGISAPDDAVILADSPAFGTGHHPTTAMCVAALEEILSIAVPERILDVGTGSGLLALVALKLGVPHAVGLDTDADALEVAAQNARLNGLADRLELVFGGPEIVTGLWPLVVANVLAAPLIDMAPVLVRRVGHQGHLVLSGIPSSVESEVRGIYTRLGMHPIHSEIRSGWTMLLLQASW